MSSKSLWHRKKEFLKYLYFFNFTQLGFSFSQRARKELMFIFVRAAIFTNLLTSSLIFTLSKLKLFKIFTPNSSLIWKTKLNSHSCCNNVSYLVVHVVCRSPRLHRNFLLHGYQPTYATYCNTRNMMFKLWGIK